MSTVASDNRTSDFFDLEHPIEGLFPASYNPREISPDAMENLKKSITLVGFSKPIICMDNGLIIAGHQRTKASRALGRTHVPAYILKDVEESDQIRFNQMHNGTDLDTIDKPVTVPASEELGYDMVSPDDIDCNTRSKGANIRSQINKFITLYGAWGCATVTQSGRVISSPHYAISCKVMHIPLRVFRIKDEHAKQAYGWLTAQYGRFSYNHLPRETYRQTFAQPMRLRGDSTNHSGNIQSILYRDLAFSKINKNMRILDFGCGQADYVKMLRRQGYKIHGIEFFHRNKSSIDKTAVHRMIKWAMNDFAKNGPFDVVLCDSVVNSVDTIQAESDVLTCLNALVKKNGTVFFSGRCREGVEGAYNATKDACKSHVRRSGIEFIDDNGFSGLFRKGTWFYQKFHYRHEVEAFGEKFFGDKELKYTNLRGKQLSWQAQCQKKKELPEEQVEAAIRREFNLPWPNGETVDRADFAWEQYCAGKKLPSV